MYIVILSVYFKMRFVLSIVLMFFALQVFAQSIQYMPMDYIKIREGHVLYQTSFNGGLVLPAIQQIDLNADGLEDLVVFDRLDNSVSTYLVEIVGTQRRYVYQNDFAHLFPEMRGFFELIDYDGDGKKDLFTHSSGAVVAYKNVGTVGNPIFQSLGPWVPVFYPLFGLHIPMYSSSADKPIIADVDADGDIDVLVYMVGLSGQIQLFKNLSRERFGHSDSLVFIADDECWGRFWSESDSLILMNDACMIINSTSRHRPEHVQFNLTAADANNDGLIDLVVGDLASVNLRYFTNFGRPDSALMRSLQPRFPVYDTSVVLDGYPAAYFIDVNQDGRKDMLVAPNFYGGTVDQTTAWYYQNRNTSNRDSFSLVSKNFFEDLSFQKPLSASPYMLDVNDDGRDDLILAYHQRGGAARVLLYTQQLNPLGALELVLVDTNFLQLNDMQLSHVYFTSGDLNGDGKRDILLGSWDGNLRFFAKNQTGFTFSYFPPQLLAIPPDTASAPELIDLNRDGKLDLVLGTYSGKLRYYTNTGSSSTPVFHLQTANFGAIDMSQTLGFPGFSKPRIADMNGNGNVDLVVSSASGKLQFYADIETSWNGVLLAQNNPFYFPRTNITSNPLFTRNSSVCLFQRGPNQSDGLMIGTERGGILAFENSSLLASSSSTRGPVSKMEVYPNPSTSGNFRIRLSGGEYAGVSKLTLFNAQGVELKNYILPESLEEHVFFYPEAGVYMLRITLASGLTLAKKLIILQH